MSSFKRILSGSDRGRGIALPFPGTVVIHTVPEGLVDEIDIFIAQTDSAGFEVSIQMGGTGASDVRTFVTGDTGAVQIIDGVIIEGIAGGTIIRGSAPSADEASVLGFVRRRRA